MRFAFTFTCAITNEPLYPHFSYCWSSTMIILALNSLWNLSKVGVRPFQWLLHWGVGEGATPFPGLLLFTLDTYLILLSAKQGGIKYHFKSLWYDAPWDWIHVSWTIGEHSTHLSNELVYKLNMSLNKRTERCIYIYIYIYIRSFRETVRVMHFRHFVLIAMNSSRARCLESKVTSQFSEQGLRCSACTCVNYTAILKTVRHMCMMKSVKILT